MSLPEALTSFVKGILTDPSLGLPGARYFTGTWVAAEGVDANLSLVTLPGGQVARYVPKLSSVTGLSAGNVVAMVEAPGAPLHIVGKLVGDITLAVAGVTDVTPPTVPGSLATGATTASTVTLTWSASTDAVGVVGYDVFVNGVYWITTTGLAATPGGLAASTSYTFTVRARDAAGNVSGAASVVGSTAAASTPPAGTTISLTYAATWSRSYNYSGHNEYDSWFGSAVHQGQYGGGNERGLIGFNSAQIQADLAGATAFLNASIKLTYSHWWANAGGTAVIGTHANGSPPNTFVGATTNRVQSGGWTAGLTRAVGLGGSICAGFANGTISGICLGPGPTSGTQYYGQAYGAGSGVYAPILTLTFVR